MDKSEAEEITKIIEARYRVTDTAYDGKTLTVEIQKFSSYPDEDFNSLSQAMDRLGFVAFTLKGNPDKLVIIDKPHSRRSDHPIKLILLIATILSVVYIGYVYVSAIDGGTNVLLVLGYSLIFYTIPIFLILAAREVGKFVALRKNGMKYQLPVFIPNPIGIGTMGTINSRSDSFRNRKAMVETGTYSLVFGLAISLFFYVFGALFSISTLHFSSISSPSSEIGNSIVSQLFLLGGLPGTSSLTPIGFAGFVGLVITAYNALPLGFLDGGLISSSVFGKNSYLLSYASIIVIVAFGILYPPVLVLAVFALLFGVKGPQPLNNMSKISVSAKSLTVVAFLILLVGIAPLPLHVTYNTFHTTILNPDILIHNSSQKQVSLLLDVNNTGAVTVFPSFGVTPVVPYNISGLSNSIAPGKSSIYRITLSTGDNLSYGFSNYTINVKSGAFVSSATLSILKINVTTAIEFSNLPSRTISIPINHHQEFDLVNYNSMGVKNSSVVRILSVGGQNLSFLFYPSNSTNTSAYISSGFQTMSLGLRINANSPYPFRIDPLTVPEYWYIVAFNSAFQGTYERINVTA